MRPAYPRKRDDRYLLVASTALASLACAATPGRGRDIGTVGAALAAPSAPSRDAPDDLSSKAANEPEASRAQSPSYNDAVLRQQPRRDDSSCIAHLPDEPSVGTTVADVLADGGTSPGRRVTILGILYHAPDGPAYFASFLSDKPAAILPLASPLPEVIRGCRVSSCLVLEAKLERSPPRDRYDRDGFRGSLMDVHLVGLSTRCREPGPEDPVFHTDARRSDVR
jgi:hypothetical protein